MEIITVAAPSSFKLAHSSDYHKGSANCKHKAIEEMVDEVASTQDYYLVNTGDSIDATLPNDKFYKSCSIDYVNGLLTPQQQRDSLIATFRPIKDKIWAWGFGNHEYRLLNTCDFGSDIANSLNVPYGCFTYKLIITDEKGKPRLKMFFHHGSGKMPRGAKDPIQREANRKAWLKQRLAECMPSDCIYAGMGHIHHPIITKPTIENEVILTDNGKSIKQVKRMHTNQCATYIPPEARWYVATASFQNTFSQPGTKAMSYSEIAMYGPAKIGWMELQVEDYQLVNVVFREV